MSASQIELLPPSPPDSESCRHLMALFLPRSEYSELDLAGGGCRRPPLQVKSQGLSSWRKESNASCRNLASLRMAQKHVRRGVLVFSTIFLSDLGSKSKSMTLGPSPSSIVVPFRPHA